MASFLGTSAAQPILADDSIKYQSLAIPQAVCQADPTTVQQQFKEGVTTLIGSKNPKKLGKRGISESIAEHGTQYCIVSGTILYMECMEEKIIPFVCHYLLLFYYLFTLVTTLFMHSENVFLYELTKKHL